MTIRRMLVAAAVCATLAGCNRSRGGGRSDFADSEPNGPGAAQDVGSLAPGQSLRLRRGQVSFVDAVGQGDEVDTFQLTASEDQVLLVVAEHGEDVDVDLGVQDPASGRILTTKGDSTTSPEQLAVPLDAGQTVLVEVEAFTGSGSYSLELRARPR